MEIILILASLQFYCFLYATADQAEPYVSVKTLPVGQGDASIVVCPLNYLYHGHKQFNLIDMGSDSWKEGAMDVDTYIRYIDDHYLKKAYKLTHIFLTHPDKDHLKYGYERESGKTKGLLPFLEGKVKGVFQIHVSANWLEVEDTSGFLDEFNQYLEEGERRGSFKVLTHRPSDVVDICATSFGETHLPSQVKMEIIVADLGTTANEMSMVMSLNNHIGVSKNNGKRMLFLGDFEGVANYNHLVKYYGQYLSADVIMVPHHGSDTNGNGDHLLYELVRPKYAIISSHILHDGNRHPRIRTINSFCMYHNYKVCYPEYEACDEYGKEMAQVSVLSGEFGFDQYFIFPKLLNLYLKKEGEENCQGKVHQTTRVVNSNDGQNIYAYTMEARVIGIQLFSQKDPVVMELPPLP